MNKFVIKIAGLCIEINSKYDYTFMRCKDYITDNNKIDFSITCNDKEIDEYSKENKREVGEFITIYEKIADELYKYNRILVHGAAISYNDSAYLFLAPSGVGKTTHINLLMSNYKGISIINGDKPIIDDKGQVYGTPWSGKEKYNNNVSYKLASIILIERNNENSIEKVNKEEYLSNILKQVYKNDKYDASLDIIDKAFKDIPVYKLSCRADDAAAKLTYDEVLNK